MGVNGVTIRAAVNRRLRKTTLVSWAGFLMFGVGAMLANIKPQGTVVCLSGFAVCAACILYMYVGIRCTNCKNGIGSLVNHGPWSLSQRVKYCPFCGVDLDTDLHDSSDETPIDGKS
jgi:hypothetical protein